MYKYNMKAIQCPVCKSVHAGQGIWVHIIGKARGEALNSGAKPHVVFLKTKAKKKPVTKYSYKYDKFKVLSDDYYQWRDKQRNNGL